GEVRPHRGLPAPPRPRPGRGGPDALPGHVRRLLRGARADPGTTVARGLLRGPGARPAGPGTVAVRPARLARLRGGPARSGEVRRIRGGGSEEPVRSATGAAAAAHRRGLAAELRGVGLLPGLSTHGQLPLYHLRQPVRPDGGAAGALPRLRG